jgi:hypothetical protein
MKIERIGDFLALKDNQNQIEHLVPMSRVFVHKHPLKEDYILLSDTSKTSIKDSIQLKATDVDRVGIHYVNKPSRGILFIYLTMLLDESRAILNTQNTIDGYLLEMTTEQIHTVDVDDLIEERTHIFNAYDAANPTLSIQGLPSENTTFRITNGGLWGLFLENENQGNIFVHKTKLYTRYQLNIGKTVEVSFDTTTGIFTITDL